MVFRLSFQKNTQIMPSNKFNSTGIRKQVWYQFKTNHSYQIIIIIILF